MSNDLVPANPGEFLFYQTGDGQTRIQVRLEGETVWLSQKVMADLFQKDVRTISEHIHNIYQEAELRESATLRKFRTVQTEGSRQVEREVDHYNLDVIISVGYRVKSLRGTQFRIWAPQRLRELIVKGFTMDDDRLKNGGRQEENHGAIAIEGLFACCVLKQKPRIGFGRRVEGRAVSGTGRDDKQPRLPIADRRRCGRSRSPVVSVGADGHDCRCHRQDQIDIVLVGESDARFADTLSLVGGLCGVFGEPVERRGGSGIHSPTTRASHEAIVPRRIARVVAEVRDRMGRTVCVGLKNERPFQGRRSFPSPIPRASPWADRTSPSGSKTEENLQSDRLFPSTQVEALVFIRPERPFPSAQGEALVFYRPERPFPSAQGEALGSQCPHHRPTLKGSFILALHQPVDRHFEQSLGELEKIEGELKALPHTKPDEPKKKPGRIKRPQAEGGGDGE